MARHELGRRGKRERVGRTCGILLVCSTDARPHERQLVHKRLELVLRRPPALLVLVLAHAPPQLVRRALEPRRELPQLGPVLLLAGVERLVDRLARPHACRVARARSRRAGEKPRPRPIVHPAHLVLLLPLAALAALVRLRTRARRRVAVPKVGQVEPPPHEADPAPPAHELAPAGGPAARRERCERSRAAFECASDLGGRRGGPLVGRCGERGGVGPAVRGGRGRRGVVDDPLARPDPGGLGARC